MKLKIIVYFSGFWYETYYSYLDYVIYTLVTLVPLLIVIALFTLAERRVMASIQRRKGPNVVGFSGFLQPFADGLKLVIKEIIIPTKAITFLFLLAPGLVFFLSFIGWVAIPFDIYTHILSLNYSLLFILVVSSMGVYGMILAGWASNSKYALFGALRSVAQMISYEVCISLCLVSVILFSGSLNLNKIIYMQVKGVWFILPLFPIAVIYFIAILAETNRAPFDLSEAEAELVSGYNVEYSAITFAAFFLGEYSNILLMCSLFVCLFLGGSDSLCGIFLYSNVHVVIHEIFFSIKVVILTALFIFVRANLPRFRFDQLMSIGWKFFLPLTLGFILFFSCLLFTLGGLSLSQLPRVNHAFNLIESVSVRF